MRFFSAKMTTEFPVDLSAKTRNVSVQTEQTKYLFNAEQNTDHKSDQFLSQRVINSDHFMHVSRKDQFKLKPHKDHYNPKYRDDHNKVKPGEDDIKPERIEPTPDKPEHHKLNLNNIFSANFGKFSGKLADSNLSESVEILKNYILEITFNLLFNRISLEAFNNNISQLVRAFNKSKVGRDIYRISIKIKDQI